MTDGNKNNPEEERLDSGKPGSNFPIGKGLGVVVTLLPRDTKTLATEAAWLEIEDIEHGDPAPREFAGLSHTRR